MVLITDQQTDHRQLQINN